VNQDFSDLLCLFNQYHVKYLVIGGYAVIQHTEPRYTKDLDVWVAADGRNAERVYAALTDFGAPIEAMTAESFTDRDSFFTMGLPPNRIDIWFSLKGIDDEEAWSRRTVEELDDVPVNFIGREDLITNKEAVGRLQDLADAEKLRETCS
jgi:hypothetical protein